MKELLITGGTGFFGRSILRYLYAKSRDSGAHLFDNVTVLSRSPENFKQRYPALAEIPWLTLVPGDVLFPDSLPKNGRYHSILHAATDAGVTSMINPHKIFQQIVHGTENMLQYAHRCGAQRFLLTSSGGAYGKQPSEMKVIKESYHGMPDPLNPQNAYGIGKRQAEYLCGLYGLKFSLEIVIARCFSFLGEDLPLNSHFAIGNFIRDALTREEIIVCGNGRPVRTYMHQKDMAHWLMTMIQFGDNGSAYNVGSDEEYSIAEVANLTRDILSPSKPVRIMDQEYFIHDERNRYVPDISKARQELGLAININLSSGIRFFKQFADLNKL